jgi:hypothetical protein
MLPWIEQWKEAVPVTETAALKLPPGIDPASQLPLSATMRCVLPVELRNVTDWPAGTDAGFGENAWVPELPTMVIVTPVVCGGFVTGGIDVGAGAGAGEPPQADDTPHARTAANAVIRRRGRFIESV